MTETIAAIGTALGEGGIGIVRVSGADSWAITEKLFVPIHPDRWAARQSHQLYLGHLRAGDDGEQFLDQVLAVVMQGPHSYTGEDMAEIHCHGGFLAVTSVLEGVLAAGARLAQAGEFTRRALLNGKLDLAQAEATIDLIRSKSQRGLSAAVAHLRGELSAAVAWCRNELLSILAYCEASIDFPDDEIEALTPATMQARVSKVLAQLDQLLASYHQGRILQKGLKTIILGKPNVGKSSLLNALLGKEKAIVTDIPGTTRDLIEEFLNLGGIPIELIDTAGIRPTDDLVEKIGVEKSREILDEADLVLLVLDAGTGITANDRLVWQLVEQARVPLIVLLNKIDLQKMVLTPAQVSQVFPGVELLEISALTGFGIDRLPAKIGQLLGLGRLSMAAEPVLTRWRHYEILTRAKAALTGAQEALTLGLPVDFLSIDLRLAWETLGEVSGETVGEDVLDRIFAEFCIGK